MALIMTGRRRHSAESAAAEAAEASAAELAAGALLRSVARQAIIAAAADAVAQVGGRHGGFSPHLADAYFTVTGGKPGGPIDEGEPKENKDPGGGGTGP